MMHCSENDGLPPEVSTPVIDVSSSPVDTDADDETMPDLVSWVEPVPGRQPDDDDMFFSDVLADLASIVNSHDDTFDSLCDIHMIVDGGAD